MHRTRAPALAAVTLAALAGCSAPPAESTPEPAAPTSVANPFAGALEKLEAAQEQDFINRVAEQLQGPPAGITDPELVALGREACKVHVDRPGLTPREVAEAMDAEHRRGVVFHAVVVGAARGHLCSDTWPTS